LVSDSGDLLVLEGGHGYRLETIELPDSASEASDAEAFAIALAASLRICPDLAPECALYVERLSRVLPTVTVGEKIQPDRALGAWVTGGVNVSIHATRRIAALAPWLSQDEISRLQSLVDSDSRSGDEPAPSQQVSAERAKPESGVDTPISLPGRPDLEAFFNEHVLDVLANVERYKRLGIGFPGAILLHGPPGSGKTFAVDKLVDHLAWPSFSIDSSSIGSPYIHETGRKIASVFEEAASAAPAIVVVDEIDAFLSAREDGSHAQHRVEEVAEFLRRIPEAAQNRVLVIGMTNRLSALDPAVVRRGRFDHLLEVGMPGEAECLAALRYLLSNIPVEPDVDFSSIAAELAGRPLSDVGFVVREACRLAARRQKDAVGDAEIREALRSTPSPSPEPKARRIGFV
jgi:hypothetical protein